MSKTFPQLYLACDGITYEQNIGGNTKEEVGGLFHDIVEKTEELANSEKVRQEAFEADQQERENAFEQQKQEQKAEFDETMSQYSELPSKVSELEGNVGDLDNLETTTKDNLVDAINEAAKGGGGGDATLREDVFGKVVDEDLVLPSKTKGLAYKSSNTWKNLDAYTIDVSEFRGGELRISTYTSSYNCCSFIKSLPTTAEEPMTGYYASGWSVPVNASGQMFVVPDDALYFNISAETSGKAAPSITIKYIKQGLKGELKDYTDSEVSKVEEKIIAPDTADAIDAMITEDDAPEGSSPSTKAFVRNRNITRTDVANLDKYLKGSHNPDFDYSKKRVLDGIVQSNVWKASTKWQSIAINVSDLRGKIFSVKCTGLTYIYSALVTSLDLVANQTPPFCEGTTAINCGNAKDIEIPNDAKYLIVSAASTDAQYHAPIVKLVENIVGLEERLMCFLNKGKSIAVFGGSWAAGASKRGAIDIWKKVLATDKIDDYAIGGAGFGNQHQVAGTKNIQEQVAELCADDAEAYDVYVLWASTNDFLTPVTGIRIGARDWFTDADDYDESKLDSQCGGINYCVKKILDKNPEAQIVFFSSCPVFSTEAGYDSTVTKQIKANDGTVTQGSFADYVRGQKDCCDRFHIPFLDQWNMLGINEYNQSVYFTSDQLHMNDLGYERLAYKQAEWLKNCIG